MKIYAFILVIISTLILTSCKTYHSKHTFTIGSGSKNAMYYSIATSLCNTFNKYNQDKNIICKAKASKGAEYNLDAVENGEFDMGIAKKNLQFDAYAGYRKFLNNPHNNLRTLIGLNYDYLTIIAKKDAHIKNFSDLKDKKIVIGNPGSGSRILFLQMINEIGWNLNDFKIVYEEEASNINRHLCLPNKADAAIFIIGHPNKSFESVLENCNTELVGLTPSEIKQFIPISPKEFKKLSIPQNIYPNNPKNINSFAVKTILFASKKLDKKIVETFIKVISQHKQELILENPSLSSINFFYQDISGLAPLHDNLKTFSISDN